MSIVWVAEWVLMPNLICFAEKYDKISQHTHKECSEGGCYEGIEGW